MITIESTFLAEVNFATAPAAGARVYFADLPQLRNQKTFGIEAISATQLTYSPNNKVVVSQANAATLMLTLAVEGTEQVYQMPVTSLIASLNGGFIRQFAGLTINLVKSYVTASTTGVNGAESILFNFIYKDKQLVKRVK